MAIVGANMEIHGMETNSKHTKLQPSTVDVDVRINISGYK